jgi:hypothetical protein
MVSGSSSVPTFISTVSSLSVERKAICEPQSAQNSRCPQVEDEYIFGDPSVYLNVPGAKDTQGSTVAPDIF